MSVHSPLPHTSPTNKSSNVSPYIYIFLPFGLSFLWLLPCVSFTSSTNNGIANGNRKLFSLVFWGQNITELVTDALFQRTTEQLTQFLEKTLMEFTPGFLTARCSSVSVHQDTVQLGQINIEKYLFISMGFLTFMALSYMGVLLKREIPCTDNTGITFSHK